MELGAEGGVWGGLLVLWRHFCAKVARIEPSAWFCWSLLQLKAAFVTSSAYQRPLSVPRAVSVPRKQQWNADFCLPVTPTLHAFELFRSALWGLKLAA
ncbi:unnamed protein product [Schistocephalus solidus]|uniref:Secreted protein n=1 Tax=Schistocephalus solidus TaxID=70667 RepID=A0A183TQS3_SCHSO|nr:unnamed protein product [Schistocephalus solidus]